MHGSDLNRDSGLLPAGIAELSLRCVEEDLFCWVFADQNANDRLLSLPKARSEAQAVLAAMLENEHGFPATNAQLTSQALFRDAFTEHPAGDGQEPLTPQRKLSSASR